jgi:KUP system potassium uptake protein
MAHGGWLPLAIGAVLVTVMLSWRYGRLAAARENEAQMGETTEALVAEIDAKKITKNSGISGVFLSPLWTHGSVLPATLRIFRQVTGSVPETCVFLTISFDKQRPFLCDNERREFRTMGSNLFALRLLFGYAEPLTELAVLTQVTTFLNSQNSEPGHLWFFLHAEDVTPNSSRRVWSKAVVWFYVFLLKISASAASFLGLPVNKVIHLGNSVAI